MDRQGEALELIRNVILEEAGRLGVRVDRIILFGSRARGEARGDSDYDILIIVEEAGWRDVFRLQSRIRIRLFKFLKRELDLIIVDRELFERRRDMWGSLEYTAEKEGVIVWT